MTAEQEALLRENNRMLKELLCYVRASQTQEWRENEDMRAFSINVAADMFVDMMNENDKERIKNRLRGNEV